MALATSALTICLSATGLSGKFCRRGGNLSQPPEFDVSVPPGPECLYVRFKNRQATPTPTATPTEAPTATPTPTATNTPTPHKLYLPMIVNTVSVCTTGQVWVEVFGELFIIPLEPDGNVKTIAPLPWHSPTIFNIMSYDGDIRWRQYQPVYNRQDGGYSFIYPGGHAGEEFSLVIYSDCGSIRIETDVDDPPWPIP